MNELHAERQRHAQDLLGLAFRFDDDGRDHRLAGLDAPVLAGEADLLGVGILALQAEFGPRRINQLGHLVLLGLAARGGCRLLLGLCRRRGRLLRGGRRGCGSCLGGRLGLGLRRRGRGCLGLGRQGKRNSQRGCRQQGEKPPTRPDRRGQDTEIHCGKPFLNGSTRNRYRRQHLAASRGCLLVN